MSMTRVCMMDEVPVGEMVRFESPYGPLLVSNVDGEYFVTQDTCTHDDWSLADGYLDGDVVECSLHWAKFCVRTGAVKALPAAVPLRTYAVTIENGFVLADLDAKASSV
ncbi:bifunctional 3-phenylpropionate/cinnamic acid dioxygenase ferredoxin subunit [Rhodococcus erythropolis]|uniref:Ferredoxin n=3 Tax=Rhodococcus TaxID=1827 RepID=Q79EQ0_RHOER|nr:ferredoxin [Rhodococcus sp. M5]BAA25621.1 ferredoxin [Rhodococcus erythropolis]CAA56348.1 ferredoxin BPH [Rhodococcus globerulus]